VRAGLFAAPAVLALRAGLYKQLASLKEQLGEYREAAQAARRQAGQAAGGPGAAPQDELALRAALLPVVAAQAGLVLDLVASAGLEVRPEHSLQFLVTHVCCSRYAGVIFGRAGLQARVVTPFAAAQADCPFTEAGPAAAHAATSSATSSGDGAAPDPLAFDAYTDRLYSYLQVRGLRLRSPCTALERSLHERSVHEPPQQRLHSRRQPPTANRQPPMHEVARRLTCPPSCCHRCWRAGSSRRAW
jgi:hypothetical protein